MYLSIVMHLPQNGIIMAETCRTYTVCVVYVHRLVCIFWFCFISNSSMHSYGPFKIEGGHGSSAVAYSQNVT
jgi:hypothetical protein